ncbi:cell division protein ZapB [Candidatus Electrothrix sp.]|uniref:cell division protein ZapB n=1 Tax=Candidatus Electrothrix sp. TaxID=2170559 RepID=UPI0040579284
MENEEFVRLEQLVDTLIYRYSELQGKYRVLKENLKESEEERELLKMELTELQEQRSEVAQRVSGLLGRIEQWEADQGMGEQMEVQQGKGEEHHVSNATAL